MCHDDSTINIVLAITVACMLSQLKQCCHVVYFDVLTSEALQALSHFQSRQVRSTAWKCNLEIGSGLTIPVCLYTRVRATCMCAAGLQP